VHAAQVPNARQTPPSSSAGPIDSQTSALAMVMANSAARDWSGAGKGGPRLMPDSPQEGDATRAGRGWWPDR
jgi:hypothetical protein